MIVAENIAKFGYQPVFNWWYPSIDRHLAFPLMHTLSVELSKITDVPLMYFFKYQQPMTGIVFFLIIYILAESVTGDQKVSAISALIGSTSGPTIFYLSEYHPQGMAIVLLLFLLFLLVRMSQRFIILFAVFGVGFTLSHYFSPLMFLSIFLGYLIILGLIKRSGGIFGLISTDLQRRHAYLPVVFILIFIITYYIFEYPTIIRILGLRALTESASKQITPGSGSDSNLQFFLDSLKWVISLLAGVAIIQAIKEKRSKQTELVIFLGLIVIAAVGSNFIVQSRHPLSRLLAFYMPIASIFASLTIVRTINMAYVNRLPVIKLSSIILVSIIVLGGVSSAMPLGFYYQSSDTDFNSWYSNEIPSMTGYPEGGMWIERYTEDQSLYGTFFDTKPVVGYWGKRGQSQSGGAISNSRPIDYTVINPNIPYRHKNIIANPTKEIRETYIYEKNYNTVNFDRGNRVYDNSNLRIYSEDYD
jgi:hypothetical protein